jgi:uncharacterized protein
LKDSRQWSKKVFTKEMVDKAFETMHKIEENRKLHSPKIILYGGEPLLAQNKEIIEYIVNRGKDLGYYFMAVTNGYNLDEFQDFLGKDKIRSLQITIDGMKEIHDQRRIHFQTRTSFDKIINNIKIALEHDVTIAIRVNTDADNFDELNRIDQLFKDLGYYEKGKLQIYSGLLFDYKDTQLHKNKSLNYMSKSEYNKRHKEVAYKYNCSVSDITQFLYKTIKNGNRINFSSVYCPAQTGTYILDPFGDIYSCWENVGNIEKIIGHYINDCIEWTDIRDLWHNQNITLSIDCVQCKYAFFCRGGCIAEGTHKRGIFGPGFCNAYPETFQYAVNLVYSMMHK